MKHNNKISIALLFALLISGCSTTTSTKFDEYSNIPVESQVAVETANVPAPKVQNEQKESVPEKPASVTKTQKTRKVSTAKEHVSRYRVGAVCNDGTVSEATGRGACSWHGGVDYWLYNK